MYVVGAGWIGTAAMLGDSHLVLWLCAILLFFIPLAAVVVWLNRVRPLEGGLYQWAHAAFGPAVGFLAAWNLWAYTVVVMSEFGIIIATTLSYLAGPGWKPVTDSAWYVPAVSVLMVLMLITVTALGLRIGKWLHGFGGVANLIAFAAVIGVPFVALAWGRLGSYHPLVLAAPAMSLMSVNIFTKMAMGAFSGFEYVAILAGECRDPARSIARATWIATPVIGFMFIFGTSSVLALVPGNQIDLISPIPQVLRVGLGGASIAGVAATILIGVLLARYIANVCFIFAGNTRLPMVAGWQGQVPGWFGRVSGRLRSPVNSILFVAAIVLALALASTAGVGRQEAFQLLNNASGILYALAYLAMFAIPVLGRRELRGRIPLWVRSAALSGFVVTLLYVLFALLPIVQVRSATHFAAKIVATVLVINLTGVGVYWAGRARGRVDPR